MKKPNFISTIAATLAVAAISTTFVAAQLQVPGDNVITSGRVSLNKGEYVDFTIGNVAGTTQTVTGTTSGTVALLKVSGSGLIATVTTTVTGTLDKKTLRKGKFGNKELLQLILNTSDKNALKGQSLVYAVPAGGLEGFSGLVGAQKKGEALINVRTSTYSGGANAFGVDGSVFGSFYESITASKKDATLLTGMGYGFAGVAFVSPVTGYTTDISGVTGVYVGVESSGRLKQTYQQNQTNGAITNVTKATFTPRQISGGGFGF